MGLFVLDAIPTVRSPKVGTENEEQEFFLHFATINCLWTLVLAPFSLPWVLSFYKVWQGFIINCLWGMGDEMKIEAKFLAHERKEFEILFFVCVSIFFGLITRICEED